jgi:hypothetical protein
VRAQHEFFVVGVGLGGELDFAVGEPKNKF